MRDSRRLTRPLIIVLVALGIYEWSRLHPKELIPWRQNFAAAEAESRQTGKPLFLYFSASWCGPCQGLKTTTWADKAVLQQLSHYIPTELDVDNQANEPLSVQYHAETEGIPFFVILDNEEHVVRSTVGYLDAANFLAWFRGERPEWDYQLPTTRPGR